VPSQLLCPSLLLNPRLYHPATLTSGKRFKTVAPKPESCRNFARRGNPPNIDVQDERLELGGLKSEVQRQIVQMQDKSKSQQLEPEDRMTIASINQQGCSKRAMA
jgi:hypothetical protein